MMGGWTRQERTVAEEHAAKLDGDERVAAEKETEVCLLRNVLPEHRFYVIGVVTRKVV